MNAVCAAARRLQASVRTSLAAVSISTSPSAANTRPARVYETSTGLQCFLQHNERGVGTLCSLPLLQTTYVSGSSRASVQAVLGQPQSCA